MDQGSLVESQIEDAKTFAELLARESFDVSAFLWVKSADNGDWSLYVVSDVVDREGLTSAYRKIHGPMLRLNSPWLTLSDVRLIGKETTFAKDVFDISHRPPLKPTIYGGSKLGSISIDQAYVYPPLSRSQSIGPQMTGDEVIQKIHDLMKRRGAIQPATVYPKNGSAFHGIPIGIETLDGALSVKLLNVDSGTQNAVLANDIAHID